MAATMTRAKIAGDGPSGSPDQPLAAGPRRTCVGCRATRTASELVRVGRDPEGTLQIGRTLHGRGAWLCRDNLASCSDQAIRKGGFSRAFRTKVTTESLSALRHQIEALTT
jgi:predicted RNA-binding protein YlxR (DUF448 family)